MWGLVLASMLAYGGDGHVIPSVETVFDAVAVSMPADTGNIDVSSFRVENPESAEPTIYLTPRRDPTNRWQYWYFKLEGVEGKRPVFEIGLSGRHVSRRIAASWRPSFTYDHETWRLGGGWFETLTDPRRSRFQLAEPFTEDTVWLADHPPYRIQDFDTLAAKLADDRSGWVRPAASAGNDGIVGASPSEKNEFGHEIGRNKLYGFVIGDPAAPTTDGHPKRVATLDAGVHAGEVLDGWALEGALWWLLDDQDPKAAAIRANWKIIVHFPINPNGRKAGANRASWERLKDPNRDWKAGEFELEETAIFTASIEAELNGAKIDAAFSLHTDASRNTDFMVWYRGESDPDILDQYLSDLDATDLVARLTTVRSRAEGTTTHWAITEHGSRLAIVQEFGTRTARSVDRYRDVGGRIFEALADTDAAGAFTVVPFAPDATGPAPRLPGDGPARDRHRHLRR